MHNWAPPPDDENPYHDAPQVVLCDHCGTRFWNSPYEADICDRCGEVEEKPSVLNRLRARASK